MKIAFCTDDKINIATRNFSEARYYSIYEILNGEIFSQEIRENKVVNTGATENAEAYRNILHDCNIFIGKTMENLPLTELSERNIEIIITSLEDVETVVNAFLASKEKYFYYYNPRDKKFTDYSRIIDR